MGIIGRFDGKQRLVIAAVTVVLVTVLALILAVQGYHTLLEETFQERSLAYVQAFAASARAWIEPLDEEMLRAASRFMLVGSAVFVQIEIDSVLVIDEREEVVAELGLTPTHAATIETRKMPGGGSYLDVSLPLTASDGAAGSVRIGIDTMTITARGRSTTFAAVGLAIVVDVLILGLLFWTYRGRSRRRMEETDVVSALAPIVVGDLRIERAVKRVTLDDKPVKLTPKQYALLEFLAVRSDRVVSEREIVEGIWAESPYADSKDVKQYIYLVRKRLEQAAPDGGSRIVTVPGFGYRLVPADVDGEMTDR